LIRHFAEDLGFEYVSAENKEQYLKFLPLFTTANKRNKSIIFEVFVDVSAEYESFETIKHLMLSPSATAKNTMKSILGEKGVKTVKSILGKN